ncbi:hypothetical protein H6G76_19750 [Nostoc sp. FACHB-152]|uniref:hypothetical protein n=1 Tax=unclassified Nostoc TaxID=2593658 RepID=UPI0016857B7F|nr:MULTISPECIES: hypothetical protein [unclassified Nostoc]MBD2449354.1 hypothetical protein [Nostoc sp. FACHB-152]MBD2472933.1 hypothetical protein [Nostoc sp. FACHB-145]
MQNITYNKDLTTSTTSELKNIVLEIVKGKNNQSLREKVKFYQNQLEPYFIELSHRNPTPNVAEQAAIVIGVWKSVWSTIPFQDIVPGRIDEQSYQIFHDDGYYANIARYAPGHQSNVLRIFTSKIPAYDLMVLQKYAIKNEQWQIQNVGIFQAFKNREKPLTIEDANNWFTNIVKSKFQQPAAKIDLRQEVDLDTIDRNTAKKFEKAYLAIPTLEHLYIDNDFRLVKSQRETKQRPSYTIAVRLR